MGKSAGMKREYSIRLLGDSGEVWSGFEAVLTHYPYALRNFSGNIIVQRIPADKPVDISLSWKNGVCVLSYKRRCDFFRGLGLILTGDDTRKPIQESAVYKKGGVMLDVSRDTVYTPEQVKEFLVWAALCGLNTCYLYMEDTYHLDGYPYFGYYRGGYSKEELSVLDDFADSLGIELIPCIQTLSHLGTTLKWDYAIPMRDTVNTLQVAQPQTYQFIREMLSQLRNVFRTHRIHIGMDEAMDLGAGAYIRQHGCVDRFGLMIQHLKCVARIADELGWTPIIWDDMFYRAKNKNSDYYDLSVELTKADIDLVPENLQLVYWDYYHNTQEEYERLLAQRSGFPHYRIFAGGIWKWNGWVPNYGKTFVAAKAALNACKNYRVDEIIATAWGDNGAEAPLHTLWPGLILFGQYIYGAEVNDDSVSRRCRAMTGLPLEGFLTIEELDLPPGTTRPNLKTVNPSKYFLYQDILMGAFDVYGERDALVAHYSICRTRINEFCHCAEYAPQLKSILSMYACLAAVLELKCGLGTAIRDAYRQRNVELLKSMLPKLDALEGEVARLHNLFRQVWLNSSRGTGLEVHDIRLGGLIGRIQTVKYRISGFVSGRWDVLDELEQEPLPFMQASNGDAEYPICNKYLLIATQNLL